MLVAGSSWFEVGLSDDLKDAILPTPLYRPIGDRFERIREAGACQYSRAVAPGSVLYAVASERTAWCGYLLGLVERLSDGQATTRQDIQRLVQAGHSTITGWLEHLHRPEYDALVARWVSSAVDLLSRVESPRAILGQLPTGHDVASHSVRVALVVGAVGVVAGWAPTTRHNMIWAAVSHDIGRPLEFDPDSLEHVGTGLSILTGRHPIPRVVYYAILHHHERCDGSGKPYGLIGDAVPWSAQALGLIDAWDEQTPICGELSDIRRSWVKIKTSQAERFEQRWSTMVDRLLADRPLKSSASTTA